MSQPADSVDVMVALGPEERATVGLFSVEGIGAQALKKLREEFGTLAAALRAPREQVAPHLRDEPTRERFLAAGDLEELADRHLRRTRELGARLLLPGMADWPRQLSKDRFPLLYVLGTLDPQASRLAVVGSRQADRYGESVATFLVAQLARRGVVIVSGGALGIDAAAHRAALGNEAPTVAVLGFGLDVVYPQEHATLFHEIVARGGALVTQYPPGAAAVRQNFVVRNKVIAGLSDATLVVRAGTKSGALGTANAAREYGRPVFSVPGDMTHPLSLGCWRLIEEDQARLVTGPGPIAAALGLPAGGFLTVPQAVGSGGALPDGLTRPGGHAEPAASPVPPSGQGDRGEQGAAPDAGDEVPGDLREVYHALGREPVQFEELLGRCAGVDAAGLASALLRLELAGRCEERAGKVFVRK